MWYLITFEEYDFIRITSNNDNIEFKYQGREDGKHAFSVSNGVKEYQSELLNNYSFAGERLTALNCLSPRFFVILNHATILLKWDTGIESLNSHASNIFGSDDKYVIIAVTEVAASNFFDVEPFNKTLKW